MIPLDTIGPIYGGDETLLVGWHVNTTPAGLAARPDLAPYVVTPSQLRRVWSGDDPLNPTATVALRFTDEAEAVAVLGLPAH